MRVVELNPPGWGGTPPLVHKIDQRELSVVLAAAIRSLGITRYHLHGASMGGVTALWLAVQFPDRVRSLSMEGSMAFVREENLVSPENIRILRDMVERNDPDGSGYPRAAPQPMREECLLGGALNEHVQVQPAVADGVPVTVQRYHPLPIAVMVALPFVVALTVPACKSKVELAEISALALT